MNTARMRQYLLIYRHDGFSLSEMKKTLMLSVLMHSDEHAYMIHDKALNACVLRGVFPAVVMLQRRSQILEQKKYVMKFDRLWGAPF